MKDESLYLDHIIESIDAIQRYTASGKQSLEDDMTYDAILRRLQVMAESTFRLSESWRKFYPKVGW